MITRNINNIITPSTKAPHPSDNNFPIHIPDLENETANWGIHINSNFGFSFKYPPTWIIEDRLEINITLARDACCLNIYNLSESHDKKAAQLHYLGQRTNIQDKEKYMRMNYLGPQGIIEKIPNHSGFDIFEYDNSEVDGMPPAPKSYLIFIDNGENTTQLMRFSVWDSDRILEKILYTFDTL